MLSPDGVVRSVDIVQGCVRLPSTCHDILHQVHTGHRWREKIGAGACLVPERLRIQ